jgi:mono/diheme cytochrome c family protein
MNKRMLLLIFIFCACIILPACSEKESHQTPNPQLAAYDTDQDSTNPQHVIPLTYQETQGKRIYNSTCVWCHADATPAGPSNRMNLTPTTPPLLNDGAALNSLSDEFLQNIITLGGSAMGKSPMMPPWGRTLTQDDIRAVIAYIRAIAQPPYQLPARPASQYQVK